jgi:hypothetical protein
MKNKMNKKGFLMTILVVVIFTLMLAELIIFTMLNTSYNNIEQTAATSSSSVNYASMLKASADAFAVASLSKSLNTLTVYEYNASMRKGNFISNASLYLSTLIINGTLPNVPVNSIAANTLLMLMGNATLKIYNSTIISDLRPAPTYIKLNETKPLVFQSSPYTLSVSYIENITVGSSSSIYNYSMPVIATIPLNGTMDLFYAQQGIYREIKFSQFNNLTSIIGNAYATYGNSSANSFLYGIIYQVPSGVTCSGLSSNVPTQFQASPFNSLLILATPNADEITNATCTAANNYGGLITYSINSISSPPQVPWLQYSSSTNILQDLQNGEKVLLYGPGMDTLNIDALRNAMSNGTYFASPFTPSYLSRASSNFIIGSQNGIFYFSNSNRQAAQFNGQSSYIQIPNSANLMLSTVTFGGWVDYKGPAASEWDWLMAKQYAYGVGACGPSLDVCFYNWVTSTNYVSNYALNKNTWYFIIAEVHNGNETVYVNGQQVLNDPLSISSQTAVGWQIGYGNSGGQFLNGSASNIQIYSTVLSASQIQQLYQEGIEGLPLPNADLVGWWPLNGNANDYSGNGNNGAPTAASFNKLANYTRDSIYLVPTPKTYPIPGTLSCMGGKNCNSALYISKLPLEVSQNFDVSGFSGSGYIMPNSGFAFMTNAIQQATISIWVNPSSPNGDIVDELGQSSVNTGWHDTWIDLVNNQVYIRVWSLTCKLLGTIPLNSWSNIVMTLSYNGVSLNYSGYINGVYKNSSSGSRSVPGGSSSMYYPLGPSDGTNCGDGGAAFSGQMANYQFYNTSLPTSQISQIYQNGISGIPVSLQNLVMWWPLNGNANDYSGLGNNGTAYDAYYTHFSGTYPYNGLSSIVGAVNERQLLNLVG